MLIAIAIFCITDTSISKFLVTKYLFTTNAVKNTIFAIILSYFYILGWQKTQLNRRKI